MLRFTRFFLLVLVLVGCNRASPIRTDKITIGVVSYGDEIRSVNDYQPLQHYLAKKTKSIVELEPAYNELQATEQIRRNRWSIVFAPPGLAAIAIEEELYTPLFPLESVTSLERSLIVVRDKSNIKQLTDLSNKRVALGQPGSAAGYYLPLYDLYGLTLAEVNFAPTPQKVLQWVSDGKVAAGALSEKDFETYRDQYNTQFRVLQKSRWIPSGVVIISNNIEIGLQEQIATAMSQAPSNIIADSGYVVDTKVPDYQEFIKLVKKVKPLEKQVTKTPVVLTIEIER